MNKYNKIQNNKKEIGSLIKSYKNDISRLLSNDKTDRDMIIYAISELLDNAFEHGNKKDQKKHITILTDITDTALTISIEDEGDGFVPKIPAQSPPLNVTRGRGLWSVRDIASSLEFNFKGNKVTVTFFFDKEKNMQESETSFSIFNGKTIIIRPSDESNISDFSEKIIDLTTDKDTTNSNIEVNLYLDLSTFNTVSSSFFGTLGATIQLPHVKQVALTGMRGSVQKIAKRFGIIDGGVTKETQTKAISDNAQKFRIFDSLEKAVLELIPPKK